MGVNKVLYGSRTVIDLSGDTVTAGDLAKGKTAHNASGEKITGTHECSGTGGGTSVDGIGTGAYVWAIYDTKTRWDYTVKNLGITGTSAGYDTKSYAGRSITEDGYWHLNAGTSGSTTYYLPTGAENGKTKTILAKSSTNQTQPYSTYTIKDTSDTVRGDNLLGYISGDSSSAYPEDGVKDGKWYVRIVGPDANVTGSKMLSGTVAYKSAGKVTGTIQNQAAQAITPGTSDKTIASGKYLSGTQTIKGDANLLAENIKSGISIFGVTGTYESSGSSGGKNVAQGTITGAGTNAVTIDTGLNSINTFALFNHSSASASGITSVLYLNGTVTGVGVSYSQYFKTIGYSAGTITIDGGKVTYTPKEDTAVTALMQDMEYTWIAIE